MKRWKLVAGVILAFTLVLALLSLTGRHTVHAEIIIPADPEKVWSVLIDASEYKEWNPVIVPLKGDFRQGGEITYQVTEPNGKQYQTQTKVIEVIRARKLNQSGGIPGFLTFDHTWLMEPVKGGTKVIQREEYRGIWLWFWDAGWLEPAYQKANAALKKKVAELKKN